MLIFTLVELADNYIKSHQAEIIFYDMRSTCSYDVFLGKSCYTNTISSVDDTTEEIRYNITPNRKHHLISNIFDIDELETSESLGNNRLICLKEKSILILKDLHNLSPCMQHLPIDYLVVGKTSISDLDRITECFKIGQLILDNTISIKLYYQHANHLKKVSNIHSIAKDGAYLIHI